MRIFDDNRAPEAVVQQSLDWLVLLTSGEATVADARAFQAWRSQSLVHAEAFRDALMLRRTLKVAAEAGAGTTLVYTPFQARTRLNRRAILGGVLAASVAGLVVGGAKNGLLPTLTELTADYHTSTGQQKKVAFAKGLSFDLNTQTSLQVHSPHAVEIVSGEAIFEANVVQHQALKILASNGEIRVFAASVNVRNTDDTVCVTCVRGSATVTHQGHSAALAQGQQLQYGKDLWRGPQPADVDAIMAWRTGVAVFHDLALSQVIHEVNRYRPGKILIADNHLRERRFSGVIQIKRPEAILAQLKSLGIQVTSLPAGIVVVS